MVSEQEFIRFGNMADGGQKSKDPSNPLRLDDQLCFALYSASRAVTKAYANILSDLGVTYPQYIALLVLWEQDGLTVHKLARDLELDGATTTPLVQRLEKLGLVDRKRSSEDERRVHIFLTTKGKRLRKKALAVPDAIRCAINVSPDNTMALLDHLKELKGSLHGEH